MLQEGECVGCAVVSLHGCGSWVVGGVWWAMGGACSAWNVRGVCAVCGVWVCLVSE